MNESISRPRLSVAEGHQLRINLVRVAAGAAGLGLVMETLLVVGGQTTATLGSLIDHGMWPFLVCMAVAVGQAATGGWPARSGAVAAVLAPAAFLGAKVLQKGMAVLTDGVTGPALNNALLTEAAMRAVEYAALTAVLAWLGRQRWAGVLAFLGAGLGIGLLFGLLIGVVLPPANLLGWAVKELVFPTGCALVIFASETLTRLLPEAHAPHNTGVTDAAGAGIGR